MFASLFLIQALSSCDNEPVNQKNQKTQTEVQQIDSSKDWYVMKIDSDESLVFDVNTKKLKWYCKNYLLEEFQFLHIEETFPTAAKYVIDQLKQENPNVKIIFDEWWVQKTYLRYKESILDDKTDPNQWIVDLNIVLKILRQQSWWGVVFKEEIKELLQIYETLSLYVRITQNKTLRHNKKPNPTKVFVERECEKKWITVISKERYSDDHIENALWKIQEDRLEIRMSRY